MLSASLSNLNDIKLVGFTILTLVYRSLKYFCLAHSSLILANSESAIDALLVVYPFLDVGAGEVLSLHGEDLSG
jgi:hypothetical protein